MGELHGVKETKEALAGLNQLLLVLVPLLKDGVQVGDALAILDKWKSDDALKAALLAAVDGVGKVPDEIKDLDLSEGLDLAMVQIQFMPKLIEAFSKPASA